MGLVLSMSDVARRLLGPHHFLATVYVDAPMGGLGAQACAAEVVIGRVLLLAIVHLANACGRFVDGDRQSLGSCCALRQTQIGLVIP